MANIKDIVDEQRISEILENTKNPSDGAVMSIISKAYEKRGLSLTDAGCLLNTKDPLMLEKMFQASGAIKNEIYGERLVFFAPLYLSSFCVNDCEYCGFHQRNPAPRKKLALEEVAEQAKVLIDMGHKRLLLEFGEHPRMNPIDYVVEVIQKIYGVKSGRGEIRRVNVNIAATGIEEYRKLGKAGIGTYQLFQETYHPETYALMHKGPKADFERQIFAHDRAMAAGIEDVGLGILFGLYDHKFDTLALIAHSQYLEERYKVGPHTISVPRLQEAPTVHMCTPYKVSDDQLLQNISILRMAVPYTGMIITTREKPELRAKAFQIGISQTSAASKTDPGGYGKENGNVQQFSLQDNRSLDDIVASIMHQGLVPSFCTACYRLGRTGENIMEWLKTGEIHNLCRPNAILTLREYLEDYASAEVKEKGREIIDTYLRQIPNAKIRRETQIRLERIENGESDLYF